MGKVLNAKSFHATAMLTFSRIVSWNNNIFLLRFKNAEDRLLILIRGPFVSDEQPISETHLFSSFFAIPLSKLSICIQFSWPKHIDVDDWLIRGVVSVLRLLMKLTTTMRTGKQKRRAHMREMGVIFYFVFAFYGFCFHMLYYLGWNTTNALHFNG